MSETTSAVEAVEATSVGEARVGAEGPSGEVRVGAEASPLGEAGALSEAPAAGEASPQVEVSAGEASPQVEVPAHATETKAALEPDAVEPEAGVVPSAQATSDDDAAPGAEAAPGADATPADEASTPAPSVLEAPPVAEGGGPAGASEGGEGAKAAGPSGRMRVVLNFDEKSASDDAAPAAPEAPALVEGVDDEHQAFFASADEAVRREHDSVLAEMGAESLSLVPPPPSPMQLARRDRARRAVTYVMGGAALLCGLGFVHFVTSERAKDGGKAPAGAPRANDVAAPGSLAAHGELARQAGLRFEQRRYREAVEQASRAVEADPSDAGPYVIWGKALVEMGQADEAKVVFSRCVERATSGLKDQCGLGVR